MLGVKIECGYVKESKGSRKEARTSIVLILRNNLSYLFKSKVIVSNYFFPLQNDVK